MKPFASLPVRLRLLLSLWLGSVGSSFAQAPNWQWVENSSHTGIISIYGPHQDRSGTLYIAGTFADSVSFGTTQLRSVGQKDGYVAKLRPGGGWQWAQRLGCFRRRTETYVQAMSGDANGNTYVGGTFADSLQVGDTVLFNTARYSALFLAKFDSLGQLRWAVTGQNHTSGQSVVRAITTDSAGHVFMAGYFGWGLGLGNTQLQGGNYSTCFVARLSAAGAYEWASQTLGTGHCYVSSLDVDQAGNLYSSGWVLGLVRFGPTTHSVSGNTSGEAYVARLSSTGTWDWAVRSYCGNATGGRGSGVARMRVNRRGEIYVTGSFLGATFRLGSSTTVPNADGPNDGNDGFVARLASGSGAVQWLRCFGSDRSDLGMALALDSAGAPYVAGSFTQTCAFDSITATAPGAGNFPSDVFIGKLSTAGAWQWIVQAQMRAQNQYALAVPSGDMVIDDHGQISLGLTADSGVRFGAIALPPRAGHGHCVAITRLAVGAAPLGLLADQSASLQVWPNPASTHVYLRGAPEPEAELLDAVGWVVRRQSLRAGTGTLDVTGLPAGLYLLRSGRLTRRVVVE